MRVAAKIIIGFLFSMTILMTFLVTSLFGVKAEDSVRLIVTEATGLQRDMVIFYADLQPMIVHGVFWLCLATFGFMLIFLYFIDHSFRGFIAPGMLCLIITFFLVGMLAVSQDHLFLFTGPATDLYIQSALDRFSQTAYSMIACGLILLAVSRWGDRLFKKNPK